MLHWVCAQFLGCFNGLHGIFLNKMSCYEINAPLVIAAAVSSQNRFQGDKHQRSLLKN